MRTILMLVEYGLPDKFKRAYADKILANTKKCQEYDHNWCLNWLRAQTSKAIEAYSIDNASSSCFAWNAFIFPSSLKNNRRSPSGHFCMIINSFDVMTPHFWRDAARWSRGGSKDCRSRRSDGSTGGVVDDNVSMGMVVSDVYPADIQWSLDIAGDIVHWIFLSAAHVGKQFQSTHRSSLGRCDPFSATLRSLGAVCEINTGGEELLHI